MGSYENGMQTGPAFVDDTERCGELTNCQHHGNGHQGEYNTVETCRELTNIKSKDISLKVKTTQLRPVESSQT